MQITILMGPSGSGKSSEVKGLLREINDGSVLRLGMDVTEVNDNYPEAVVLSADDFTWDKEGNFYPENLSQAHSDCIQIFFRVLDRQAPYGGVKRLVVDNTNTTLSEVAPYMAIAGAFDAPVNVLVLDTPFKECLHRNNNRVRQVPSLVVRRMCRQLQETLDKWPPFWAKPEIIVG